MCSNGGIWSASPSLGEVSTACSVRTGDAPWPSLHTDVWKASRSSFPDEIHLCMYTYMRCGSPGGWLTNSPAVCLSPWGSRHWAQLRSSRFGGWAQPGVREPYKCDTLSSSWYKHGSALQLTSCWDACTSHQAKQP